MSSCPSIKRNETARQAYIRLLSEHSKKGIDDRDVALSAELIRAGYMDGEVLEDSDGLPTGCSISSITLEGRIFEQNMRKLEREESFWHKSFGYLLVLVGYAFGVLSPLFTDLVRNCFK